MQIMTNASNRTRVQAGIKTGGQFAAESHQEPKGVRLAGVTTSLDQAAVAAAGDMVRTKAAVETGRWQRRQDKGHMQDQPMPSLPPALAEINNQAQHFESLSREDQAEVMDKLELGTAKFMLEPGQQLGAGRIRLADGLDTVNGKVGLALIAQKQVAEARIPGTITMVDIGDSTDFVVHDGGIAHTLSIGTSRLSFSSQGSDEEDYARSRWLNRADAAFYGGSVLDEHAAGKLRSRFTEHRESAVLMDAMAGSSFREHDDYFGELNRQERTVEVKVDGTEILLDVSGADPVLKVDGGKALHPSMVQGFLDHMALRTGLNDGEAFASHLREVFRETDRRLIR